MRQVLGHSPFETEADTFLQLALEEADATKSVELREARSSILGQLPPDATSLSFRSNLPSSKTTPRHPSDSQRSTLLPTSTTFPVFGSQPNQPRHRKVRSTAESLYILTKDLEAFHSNLLSTDESTQEILVEHTTIASVDTMDSGSIERISLLKNAEIVLKHELESFRASQRREPTKVHRWASGRKSPDRASQYGRTTEGDPEHKSQVELKMLDSDEEKDASERSRKPSSGQPLNSAKNRAAEEFQEFEDWLRYKRSYVWTYSKVLLLFVMVPATGIASILFYLAGNPPCNFETCTKADSNGIFNNDYHIASASWWLLFICCRQVVTFSMARAMESFTIDYVAIRTRWAVRFFGPYVTLCIVQSKGWPCTLFFWAFFDFVLLYGDNRFANHWYDRPQARACCHYLGHMQQLTLNFSYFVPGCFIRALSK
jgi:hypothetical protein